MLSRAAAVDSSDDVRSLQRRGSSSRRNSGASASMGEAAVRPTGPPRKPHSRLASFVAEAQAAVDLRRPSPAARGSAGSALLAPARLIRRGSDPTTRRVAKPPPESSSRRSVDSEAQRSSLNGPAVALVRHSTLSPSGDVSQSKETLVGGRYSAQVAVPLLAVLRLARPKPVWQPSRKGETRPAGEVPAEPQPKAPSRAEAIIAKEGAALSQHQPAGETASPHRGAPSQVMSGARGPQWRGLAAKALDGAVVSRAGGAVLTAADSAGHLEPSVAPSKLPAMEQARVSPPLDAAAGAEAEEADCGERLAVSALVMAFLFVARALPAPEARTAATHPFAIGSVRPRVPFCMMRFSHTRTQPLRAHHTLLSSRLQRRCAARGHPSRHCRVFQREAPRSLNVQ